MVQVLIQLMKMKIIIFVTSNTGRCDDNPSITNNNNNNQDNKDNYH